MKRSELSYEIIEAVENGEVSLSGNVLIYEHDGSESTQNIMTYRVSDGELTSNIGTIE